MFSTYVDVYFQYPLEQSYTYLLPASFSDSVVVGSMVEVELINRAEPAIVCKIHSNPPDVQLKPVLSVVFDFPVVTEAQLQLARWMSDHYLCSVGEALFMMFPSPRQLSNKAKERLTEAKTAQRQDQKSNIIANENQKIILNQEQADVLSVIQTELADRTASVHLLHGITGSGKTEIYIRALAETLRSGRSGILLVPEIALTVQTLSRLEQSFGDELALLHSKRKPKERFAAYIDVLEGRRRIIVGTRSAVFAPVKDLGLIILDEEHDSSYREHSNPRYDARQIARHRIEIESSMLLLGSATPRVEIRYACETFDVRNPNRKNTDRQVRFFYHRLTGRAKGRLPVVSIIEQQPNAPMSRTLLLEIEKNFRDGRQSVLLLNRRGYQPFVQCRSCKSIWQCPHCSVGLVAHHDGRYLCHQCGYTMRSLPACSQCGGILSKQGTAVQKIEEHLLALHPTMRIERLDTDSAAKVDVEAVLDRFLSGQIDVLTGTQMIAKGLDSPNVTLVGVLQSDRGLALPDFRAHERVFSLLMQVAGRAGRGDDAGRVFFEAVNPTHQILQMASHQNYDAFYEQEIADRKENGYPPFRRLVRLLIRSKSEELAERLIFELADTLSMAIDSPKQSTPSHLQSKLVAEILGPAPAPLTKLHNQFRYHLILRTTKSDELRLILKDQLPSFRERLGDKAYLEIEFDPLDML